jgi:adenylylsulfate kinase-like enzyme
MIIVLFGQPHSGKTTIANSIKQQRDVEIIDGDRLRDIFQNKDYSKEGRIKNLNRASDIAHYLNSTTDKDVILALVYPYKEARDYLNSLTKDVKWVYLTYEINRGREKFHVQDFEYPEQGEALYLNTEWMTEEECITEINKYINGN